MKPLVLFFIIMVSNVTWASVQKTSLPKVYFCILAGGSGERLWPLSRTTKPKQLLALNSQKTLLEQAIDRVRPLVDSADAIWVITSAQHKDRIIECVGSQVGKVVVEPHAKNTGPAIAYASFLLAQQDPDALVVFLPADPFIPQSDNHLFQRYVHQSILFAQSHEAISLLGVEPTYPATGYGYIEYADNDKSPSNTLCKVMRFHEKPSQECANHYVQHGNMLWNIGMFCGKVQLFLQEFKRYCPQLFNDIAVAIEYPHMYAHVQSISIDHAIMEHSDRVWVCPVDFTWFDVGNVNVFLSLQDDKKENVISVNAHNNLVSVPDRLVALVGVDDLCVVQTEDALLITRKDEVESVKKIVKELKDTHRTDYL